MEQARPIRNTEPTSAIELSPTEADGKTNIMDMNVAEGEGSAEEQEIGGREAGSLGSSLIEKSYNQADPKQNNIIWFGALQKGIIKGSQSLIRWALSELRKENSVSKIKEDKTFDEFIKALFPLGDVNSLETMTVGARSFSGIKHLFGELFELDGKLLGTEPGSKERKSALEKKIGNADKAVKLHMNSVMPESQNKDNNNSTPSSSCEFKTLPGNSGKKILENISLDQLHNDPYRCNIKNYLKNNAPDWNEIPSGIPLDDGSVIVHPSWIALVKEKTLLKELVAEKPDLVLKGISSRENAGLEVFDSEAEDDMTFLATFVKQKPELASYLPRKILKDSSKMIEFAKQFRKVGLEHGKATMSSIENNTNFSSLLDILYKLDGEIMDSPPPSTSNREYGIAAYGGDTDMDPRKRKLWELIGKMNLENNMAEQFKAQVKRWTVPKSYTTSGR